LVPSNFFLTGYFDLGILAKTTGWLVPQVPEMAGPGVFLFHDNYSRFAKSRSGCTAIRQNKGWLAFLVPLL
jgi:hypothetical protein